MIMEDITFDIEIEHFGVYNELNGCNNVIHEIRAYYVGTVKKVFEGGESSETANEYFVVHIPTTNLDNFIEYENITKEDAVRFITTHAHESLIPSLQNKVRKALLPQQQYLKPNF